LGVGRKELNSLLGEQKRSKKGTGEILTGLNLGLNLIAGYGDATVNGFWIGMFLREEIVTTFGSLKNFVNEIGNLF